MRIIGNYILYGLFLIFTSCEDIIKIDLNEASPKVVIEADLNNLDQKQVVRLSKTVSFDAQVPNEPIKEAVVVVTNEYGQQYAFQDKGNGEYVGDNFKPRANLAYTLKVDIGDDVFTSTVKMYPFVPVDTLGIKEEVIFNKVYYSAILKFVDPISVPNYYKYDMSINGNPLKFAAVFSDKYNDGLLVSHQLMDRDKFKSATDEIVIRRQCISEDVYRYWSEIQQINPGNAAPANPTSNISNGALGYFSVSSASEYKLQGTALNTIKAH